MRGGNLLDTLCARLETLMRYEQGERDLVMLQHKFVVEWKDGSEVRISSFFVLADVLMCKSRMQQTITSTLEAYGSTLPEGYSAMARLVGLPCGIATQLVLEGVLNTPGVQAPYSKEICDPLREALEKEGVGMVEKIL